MKETDATPRFMHVMFWVLQLFFLLWVPTYCSCSHTTQIHACHVLGVATFFSYCRYLPIVLVEETVAPPRFMHIMFWVLGLFLTMLVLVPIILVKETVPPPRFMHVMFWVVRLFLPLQVAMYFSCEERVHHPDSCLACSGW